MLVLASQGKIDIDDGELERLVRDKTNLLNPLLAEQMTIDQALIKAKNLGYFKDYEVPEVQDRPIITEIPTTDEQWQTLFPPRTKADMSVRRSRLQDWQPLMDISWLNKLRNLDYITVANLTIAREIHGPVLEHIFTTMGMLSSLEHYIRGANSLNQIAKKYPLAIDDRLLLAELGNLTGYRQMPMPGFDIYKEASALAHGGEPHGLQETEWDGVFNTAAREVMRGQVIPPVEFLTLEEYIRQDLASTSGSSTIGKMHYNWEENKGKFKARKNMVMDLFTAEEVIALVKKNYTKQTATAFVKPELGKLRVAVTGDIEAYYVSSWLNYLCGHCYTSWDGNTLEESATQQLKRMERTLDALIKAFSLPFDYKGFDHQPTLTEIKILLREYLASALRNVPPEYQEEVRTVIDDVVESFSETVMIIRDGDKTWQIKVTGGVQSGVRLTSLLGNMWNQTMTVISERLCELTDVLIMKLIRGDDSSLISRNYAGCLLARLGYQAINAQGHDAKYGIHYQETEFLRIWYANDRVYGYPNRAIPSLVQRKPWTSDPWGSEAVVISQLETIKLIERRVGRPQKTILDLIINSWQRKRGLS